MIKHEIKVEFSNSEAIRKIIQKAYFENNQMGKIKDKTHYITLNASDNIHETLNGLNRATVKIINEEVIDGTMRFIIDESHGDLRLYPISIYCIKENDKYIFY